MVSHDPSEMPLTQFIPELASDGLSIAREEAARFRTGRAARIIVENIVPSCEIGAVRVFEDSRRRG
jgi:hypothetical protein